MEIFRNPVEDESCNKKNIRHDPIALQEKRSNISTAQRETEKFECNYRRGDDSSKHDLGRLVSLLYHKPWNNSEEVEVSRGANKICFSTPESTGEMGSTFRNRISTSIPSTSNCDQCDVEIKATEDNQGLVWGDTDRPLEDKRDITGIPAGQRPNESASFLTNELDSDRALGIRQLCRDQPIDSFSILQKRLADQTSFNLNGITGRSTILRKLPHDLETQYSQDIPSLLYILKHIYPFNETSSDVLSNYEINNFSNLYGISNVHPILESDDNYVIWFVDTAGAIYIWSRIDNSLLYVGDDMRKALLNYLFHQDEICYVMEETREIIPRNIVKQEARKLAELCEHIDMVITKESLKPLKGGSGKRNGKKKGKKKNKK